MSGKPYPEGVTKVMADLSRIDTLNVMIEDLQPKAVKYCEDLKKAREELAKITQEVETSLDKMDLRSQGNWGFGGRMGWFLAEMRRQITKDVEEKLKKEIEVKSGLYYPPTPNVVG